MKKQPHGDLLSLEEERAFITAYTSYESSMNELLDKYPVSRSYLKNVLRHHKVPNKPRAIPLKVLTESQEEGIVLRWLAGASTRELAADNNVCGQTVVKVIRNLAVYERLGESPMIPETSRKGKRLATAAELRILQMWDARKSSLQISQELRVPRVEVALTIATFCEPTPRVVKMGYRVLSKPRKVKYERLKLLIAKLRLVGPCDLCQTPAKLYVDHCHKTGFVRGLLCPSCNTGLGQFKDSITTLKRAAAYLEKASRAHL